MRTALCMAIAVAAVVGDARASFAQDSRVPDPGKHAGTAKNRVTHQGLDSSKGISLVVPTGKISVDHGSPGGEQIYVRRSTGKEGVTMVEVSTTPFMPVLASNEGAQVGSLSIVKPDQPAGW